ncbi:acyltransferase [Archangium gephyra]|uniref:acyltransferase family protein n=1 Tax=Archangium gephyra TaxID=48 RepID=UPI0035D46BB4
MSIPGRSTLTAAPVSSERFPGLDALRVFAILGVVGRHYPHTGAPAWFAEPTRFGWVGVDLFFVLSGFLIGRQLLEPVARGELPRWGTFYLRRVFRILPSYWVVLAVYALAPWAGSNDAMAPLWRFLTFTQNFVSGSGAFGHAWSLCVEEQFYLVLPLLVLALHRVANARKIALLVLGLAAAGMALRAWLWWAHLATPPEGAPLNPIYWRWIYGPTWNRMDGLMAGVVLALVNVFRPEWWARWHRFPMRSALLAGGLLLPAWALCTVNKTLWGCVLLFPLLAAGFAALVVFATTGPGTRILGRIPGVRWLASVTYCVYLTHQLVKSVVLDWMGARGLGPFHPLTALAFIGGLLAVSAGLHLLVERPFLRWREQWAHPVPPKARAAEA